MSRLGPWLLSVAICGAGVSRAGEPYPPIQPSPSLWDLRHAWQARKCWCLDDYCPRPLPCPPPCVTGCCDDYCPRKCPLIVPTCFPPWYVCVPAVGGGCPHGNSACGACERPEK